MTLNSVVLPAPLGPIRPVMEFLSMVSEVAVHGADAAEVHVQIRVP